MLTDSEFEVLAQLRDSLRDAKHGDSEQLVNQAATLLGCSVPTIYRKLKQAGFKSERKRRADAGASRLPHEQLKVVSGVLLASTNQKGQRMPLGTALDMLRASGAMDAGVSKTTVARQLYARHLHPTQLNQPTQAKRLTSLHPNHVWQVDSTTGAYYYLPGGHLRWMDEAEFNKNKVHNLVKASTDLLTRYAATDHTSHAFKVKYFLGGETAQNLIEFMVWAISKQPSGPMHGVPSILMADQGPANKSHLMDSFCKRLDIKLMLHKPGNARATGSVEKAHDLARMHLETRYRFQDPNTVNLASLNAEAERWAVAYCTSRVHTRHRLTRFDAWMQIKPEQLRVPATEQALREAATSRPETPRVDNTKCISFKGKPYSLDMVPGVQPGMKVTVQLNVFRAPAIDVLVVDPDTGEETWHVVQPEQRDAWGFDGRHVIGEGYKGLPGSIADQHRGQLTREAYSTASGLPSLADAERARKAHAQAYAGLVDPMADVNATQVPTYMPRRATELALPERRVEARRLSVVEACKALRDRLGSCYTPQVFTYLSAEFADGVPEGQLDALAARYRAANADDGPAQAVQGL